MDEISRRQSILRTLLDFGISRRAIGSELRAMPWDSSRTFVIVTPQHVLAVLERYRAGELAPEDVEWWANAIEGRDGIGIAEENETTVREVLHELANPLLTTPLTLERAAALTRLLADR